MNKSLEEVYQAGLEFLTPFTLKQTYKVILEQITKLSKLEKCSIYLASHRRLYHVASNSSGPHVQPRPRGFAYKAYAQSKITTIDGKTIQKIHPEDGNKTKISVFIPLTYKNTSLGTFILSSRKKNQISKEKLEALKLFGSLATLTIRKAQLHDELQRAINSKNLFISLASHELKTPLTVISLIVQLMQKTLNNGGSIDSSKIERLSVATNRLTKLVNELLQVDQININRFSSRPKKNHLKKILKSTISDLKLTHPDRAIVFNDQLNHSQDSIVCDSDKLAQAFTNILNNAIKFSPENTTIRINLTNARNDLLITVKDEGQGINKEDLPKIFDLFYKGDDPNAPGMGLGLFLVKDIIKKHGGIIKIRSQPNQGTTVILRLPKKTNNGKS